jgi:hypothetical protein
MRFRSHCSVRLRAADAAQRRAGFRKIRMGVSSEEVARWTRFPLRVWGADMKCPFPGMDPYLEHPVLWQSVHARLMVAIANQLQPKLDPRYVASIEERVFIEGPQRRIPDEWIQKVSDAEGMTALADPESDTALIVEVDDLEIRGADATLDLQAASEQVYVDGRYWRRIRYDEKCVPRLSSPDQIWADERIALFRTTRPDLFPR